jgi:hypothetical protein
MATHQTAHFFDNLMLSHKKSILRIGCYLLDMCKCGIIYKPDKTKALECYIDANFADGWSQADQQCRECPFTDRLRNYVHKLPYFMG